MDTTELININSLISEKRQDENIIFFANCSDWEKIIQHRPLTFILKSIESFQKKHINSMNYEIEHISSDLMIGIRSDLHSLGFSLSKLKKIISNSKFKSELIEKEIVPLISNPSEIKNKNSFSRDEELDILSSFF